MREKKIILLQDTVIFSDRTLDVKMQWGSQITKLSTWLSSAVYTKKRNVQTYKPLDLFSETVFSI